MNAADVELHARYVARNSTNTAVYAGMKLTQYQAMQSILLASSGNMSDTLVIWAFGSLDAYYAYANDMVKRFGATRTTIGGDASGLSPRTMSTATDMALLTLQAMKQPAIAEIAAQKTAQVPYAGTIRSSNRLLGKPGVVGLKTGETVEAGGNFLLALRHTDAGHSQYVAVVVYGAELASIATADSYALYESAAPFVKYQEVVPKSEIVAQYQVPRAEPAQAITGRSVHAWTWTGLPVEPRVSAEVITQATKHCSTVGSLSYGNDTTPLVLVRDTKTSC